jgi:hypothetical protein
MYSSLVRENPPAVGNAPGFFPPCEGGDCGYLKCLKWKKPPHPEWVTFEICLLDTRTNTHEEIIALRMTLNLLFRNVLGIFDGDTGWNEPQLMLVDCLGLEQGRDGACLGISFSPTLSGWLKQKTNGTDIEIPEVEQVMRHVHDNVLGAVGRTTRFRCEVTSKGYIAFHVPGDATFLSTGENPSWEYRRFSTHNCDSFSQQMTLFVGAVVISDLFRQAG